MPGATPPLVLAVLSYPKFAAFLRLLVVVTTLCIVRNVIIDICDEIEAEPALQHA